MFDGGITLVHRPEFLYILYHSFIFMSLYYSLVFMLQQEVIFILRGSIYFKRYLSTEQHCFDNCFCLCVSPILYSRQGSFLGVEREICENRKVIAVTHKTLTGCYTNTNIRRNTSRPHSKPWKTEG